MNEDPFEGLIGSRHHRHEYLDYATGSPVPRAVERPEPSGKERMFLEDLRLQALPYGRGLEDGFTLEVHPSNESVSNLIRDALPVRAYRHWRLEESFRDYIQSAIWYLAQGDLFLEIEYFRAPGDENGPPVAFAIDVLHPELVTRRFGKYRYFIPVAAEVDKRRWSKEPLDPNCLVVVSLPRRLRREVDRTLRIIRAADQDLRVMSDFMPGIGETNSGFEFSAYQRKSHDIVLRASRATGWTGRGLFAENLLDPAKAWRAIQFARLVVDVRDIALQGAQEAIDRAGTEMGFSARLELSNVLTPGDLDRMEDHLEKGTGPIGSMFFPKPTS